MSQFLTSVLLQKVCKQTLEAVSALQKALIKNFVPTIFHCPWMPTNLSLSFTDYSYVDVARVEPMGNDTVSERSHVNSVLACCAPTIPSLFYFKFGAWSTKAHCLIYFHFCLLGHLHEWYSWGCIKYLYYIIFVNLSIV